MNTQRILKLEGGCNFRDLGGYRTRDGRKLQRGRVFRTGVLSWEDYLPPLSPTLRDLVERYDDTPHAAPAQAVAVSR